MSRRRLLSLLAAGAAAGLVTGWLRPLPDLGAASDRDAGTWSLPLASALERSTAEQFAAIQGLPWVGETSGPGSSDSPDWTLRGVLPPENAILVQAGGDPLVRRIQVGDTLPDGSRLVVVGRDAAVLERDGCRTRRELYPRPGQDTKPQDSACAAVGPNQDISSP